MKEIQWSEITKYEKIQFESFRNLCIQFGSMFATLICLISP
ncbi:hypothetical protein LEP1GSC038_2763 [Leptospira weilii str. 2006001855]|uniref:Uncharacterized protein n=2 Tax=Leptospira weilii TaxID=28184 RepID=M6Q6R6_9LEPT|nr:hypothetical protein LEP1GSC038_2763 [Leptospira weilii str. 2006001855]EMN88875.1 hypothetical protein LEP1GSC108_4122 [Leptospira weilii str. UI 13098]